MTVSNLDMYFLENSPIKSYSSEMWFTIIKCISSSSQPISIFFLNYFLGSIEGTLAYYSLEPESLFSVLWRRRRGRVKWRVLLTKGGVGS